MSKRIYVGNLPFSASDDEIRTRFAEFGTVEGVDLVTDRDSLHGHDAIGISGQ